jgi:MFS family permease
MRGRAFGLNQSASSAGTILGPLLGGYIGSYLNPRGVFALAGFLYLVGGLWVYGVVQPMQRRTEVSSSSVTG